MIEENWRDKAGRLLALSREARQAGAESLADVLLEAANKAYQFAEQIESHKQIKPTNDGPLTLQQQQIQPKE